MLLQRYVEVIFKISPLWAFTAPLAAVFQQRTRQSGRGLEMVHKDICGPM